MKVYEGLASQLCNLTSFRRIIDMVEVIVFQNKYQHGRCLTSVLHTVSGSNLRAGLPSLSHVLLPFIEAASFC